MAEAKLTRKLLKQFASAADVSEIDVFGSLAAMALATSLDPDQIQSLSAWLDGWAAEVVDDENPVLEDRNAVDYVYSWMMKTIFQMGVPEWLITETYFVGSLVNSSGNIYKSLSNTNIGNAVTNPVYWQRVYGGKSLNPQANSVLGTRAVSTWLAKSASNAQPWIDICWSPELALFAAVAEIGSGNAIMTSPDGTTWTGVDVTGVTTRNLEAICWAPQYGLFIVVASDVGGAGSQVITSPDGVTWTARTAAEANIWLDVCYSEELGRAVAVSQDGTNRAMYSDNGGVTWVAASPPAGEWVSVCWSPKLNRYVAISQASTNRVAYSDDGITWTAATPAEVNAWQSVCWSEDLEIYVAVASGGTNRVMYSRDGILWTAAAAAAANQWVHVSWAAELGELVAVSVSGSDRVMVSRDGITWASKSASDDANSWRATVWAPSLGIFAGVSIDGTNRVMVSTYVKKFVAA